MTEIVSVKTRIRNHYLDNLRIYLTITVIFHHGALAYGGAGNWGVIDPATDSISPIFLGFFNALNQSYFMSAFFLLAGYFTPRSLETKGVKHFLMDRLIRLGIPILVYTTLILNLNAYMLDLFYRRVPFRLRVEYQPGHLWFLQALLFFAFLYVLFKAASGSPASKKTLKLYKNAFPPDAILFLCIGVLSVLTFLEHLAFPVGKAIFLNFQAGFFIHYAFCFYCGVLAWRGDWFNRLSGAQARRWGIMSVAVIPLFFVMFILGGALEGEENISKFTGGLHWQAFAFSLWLTFLMVGIIVFLVWFFREKCHQAGRLTKFMAGNVFSVYIIHQTILYALNVLFLNINIPSIIKFFAVSIIAVPVCFLLSSLIRKIPYARRVLG
jgi:glucans biosynthesis protein C